MNEKVSFRDGKNIDFPRIGHKTELISNNKIANIRERLPFIQEEHKYLDEYIIRTEAHNIKEENINKIKNVPF